MILVVYVSLKMVEIVLLQKIYYSDLLLFRIKTGQIGKKL